MTEQHAFDLIDFAINDFVNSDHIDEVITVSSVPKSDGLIFKYRRLEWKKDINYLIELFPSFDEQEHISGWNLSALAYFDKTDKRYYTSKRIAADTAIEDIAERALLLLKEAYQSLSSWPSADAELSFVDLK
jgi:hypothetical protein